VSGQHSQKSTQLSVQVSLTVVVFTLLYPLAPTCSSYPHHPPDPFTHISHPHHTTLPRAQQPNSSPLSVPAMIMQHPRSSLPPLSTLPVQDIMINRLSIDWGFGNALQPIRRLRAASLQSVRLLCLECSACCHAKAAAAAYKHIAHMGALLPL
jgi:hypothetical protein